MLNYQGSRDGPSRKEALGEPLCMKWRLMAHAIRRFHSSIRQDVHMCGGTKTYRGIEGKRFDRLTRTLFFSLACALTLL